VQLRKRLARVGRALEVRGNHAATKAVTGLVQGHLLREQGQGCAPPSSGGGPEKAVSGSGPEKLATTAQTDAGVHARPAPKDWTASNWLPEDWNAAIRMPNAVFVGRLPKDWTAAVLQAAAVVSLGEGVLEGALLRHIPARPGKGRGRYVGLLTFKVPEAALGFLESVGASEDGVPVEVDMGGQRVSVRRYRADPLP